MSTSVELHTVKEKLSQLLDAAKDLKDDNKKMSARLSAEKAINQQLRDKIFELESTLTAVLLSKTIQEVSTTPRSARTRLNNMIKQLDKCIALLNK